MPLAMYDYSRRWTTTNMARSCLSECRSFKELLANPVNDEIHPESFTSTPTNPTSLWQFTGFVDGQEMPLEQFKSKATIVVNVASE